MDAEQARRFLRDGGACGALIEQLDWARTELGPIEAWPASLRATLANLLHARQPMLLFWGERQTQFYNDAFVPSFGAGKHPAAMGQPARECWAEAWPVVGAQLEAVMTRGEPAWHEDALVPIVRNGRMEEVFWTYSYSPAFRDDGRIQGVLVIVTEVTGRTLGARRLDALARLGAALPAASTRDEVLAALTAAAHAAPADVPWLRVIRDARGAPALGDAVARARAAGDAIEVALPEPVPGAVWPEPVVRALVAPLPGGAAVAFGLSPRLPFDDAYAGFLRQLVAQVTSALRRIEAAEATAAMHEQLDVERRTMLAALENAGRAKDEFLAMLGHELRNPLAPIVTALELLKDPGASRSNAVQTIERHVSHVIRLVDDLLDIAKITRGKFDLERAPTELRDVVETALESTAHLFRQRGHAVRVATGAGATVIGDRARLVQIVTNLLTNAARYTPPGGRVEVALADEGGDAVLRVRDDGRGIDPALLPHIFDLFVQGERNLERGEGGLGIGLALVKNLVQMHGGTVDVASDGPGRGSVFTVRLPRVERPAAPAPAPGVPGTRAGTTGKRVLLVDDNEDAVSLLGDVALDGGYDVEIAHDGHAALAAITRFAPHVAVLDIGLPDMDGYELATRVQQIHPACRLIALSGYGQEKDRQRAHAAGFATHLVKPVRVEAFLRAIAGE